MENFELKKALKYSAFLVLIVSVFFVVKIISEIKSYGYIGSEVYPQSVITVSGKGEVFAVPDVLLFSFTFSTESATVSEAQDKNADKINKAISVLKDNKVEERDIKTIGYNINPKYEYSYDMICVSGFCPPANQKITGYEVSQSISVKMRETDKAGSIISELGKTAPSFMSGIVFEIDDMESVKAEARKMAIEDAKEKAKTLSRDLDIKLVKILSFSESDEGRYPIYGMGGDASLESAKFAPDFVPEIPVGENKVISQVYITYEIRD